MDYMTDQAKWNLMRDTPSYLRHWVESGSAQGFTPEALSDRFDRLWTIEIAPDYYQATMLRCLKKPNVVPILGDAEIWIPLLARHLDVPIVWWLDGHYVGGSETGRGNQDTPIVIELENVLVRNQPDIIFVDDARLFGTDPAYPTKEFVAQLAERHSASFELVDDLIVLRKN